MTKHPYSKFNAGGKSGKAYKKLTKGYTQTQTERARERGGERETVIVGQDFSGNHHERSSCWNN